MLPSYDKSKRKKTFEKLPKGAYVIKILNVIEEANKSGYGRHLRIAFDIAEGEYKDIYLRAYEDDTKEDRKWSNDATFYLNVPENDSPQYVYDNWNTFFSDLEDSNDGFVFDGQNLRLLIGKVIGGKFHIEQTEFNDKIYDHTRLKWTCAADDVRNGRVGRMPADKLIGSVSGSSESFMTIPDSLDEQLPFT